MRRKGRRPTLPRATHIEEAETGSSWGGEEPLLPALAPQFGERRAIALQPGGQHKAEDEQHDEQRVHFAAALHPLPVVAAQPVPDRGQQVLPQRGELAPPPGRVGGDGPRPAATARERPVAQQLAEIRSPGQGPDLLGGLRRLAAVRLAARCQAQQLPARRLVAGAGMLLRIHIRFQQERAAAMELVPVGRQPARGGVEQQAAEQALAAVAQEVGHVAAERLAVAQRVVALDPLLPRGESRPVRDGVQPQRSQAGEIGGARRLGGRALRERDRPGPGRGAGAAWPAARQCRARRVARASAWPGARGWHPSRPASASARRRSGRVRCGSARSKPAPFPARRRSAVV